MGVWLFRAKVKGVAGLKAIGVAVQSKLELALEHVTDFLTIVLDDPLCLTSGLLNHEKALEQMRSAGRDAAFDRRTVSHFNDVPFALAQRNFRLLLLLVVEEAA